MKLLVHTCCGPCLVFPADKLCEQGHNITTFYYNPNIHPYSEYARRREAWLAYCDGVGIPTLEEIYDYQNHLRQVVFHEDDRCALCYRMRLNKTAEAAAARGFDGFTTTLLVSPYQKHEEVKTAGEEAAGKYGVAFLYQDFRDGYREGRRKARDLGLYSQKYCGCVYSEEERFA